MLRGFELYEAKVSRTVLRGESLVRGLPTQRMVMPDRNINTEGYRYGMNGQEKTDEIHNGHYTAEFWEYDSRLGRRWNLQNDHYFFDVKIQNQSNIAFNINQMRFKIKDEK